MGTLKPGSPMAFQQLSSNAAPHFLQPAMVWCRSSERSTPGEPEKAAPPEDCFFFDLYFSHDNEEGRGLLLEQEGAEPPPSCQFVFGHEGKGDWILIPKNGWTPAKWSAGIIRPNHGVLWLSMAPASPNCSQSLTAFFRSLRLESFGEPLGV